MEQHETEVDVVVVGGGSAGSTAAIRAPQELPLGRVLLLEKAHVKRNGADHYPSQLSGGMQQRVEIARVLQAMAV